MKKSCKFSYKNSRLKSENSATVQGCAVYFFAKKNLRSLGFIRFTQSDESFKKIIAFS
jgi:hypothetical protein